MAMEVPQGPGSALKFMTDEPSTCFTPNFESARTPSNVFGQSTQSAETIDFQWTQDEESKGPSCNVESKYF